jgi:adenosine deaminase CECR1
MMSPPSFAVPERYASAEEYFKTRNLFIAAERDLGYEGQIKNKTDVENQAENIVRRLKKWEEDNHHGFQKDGSGHEAGHKFLHGLDSISSSNLLAIANKAPKGCLLHVHFDAMLPPETFLEDARKQSRLYINTDVPLSSPGFFAHGLAQFNVFSDDESKELTADVFSKTYTPGTWMKYSDFCNRFPGDATRAEGWLRKRIVMDQDDIYHARQTVNG